MCDDVPIDVRLARAEQAARARSFEEADGHLGAVLAQDPDNLRALDLLGFVRFFQDRYPEAETCCRRALALRPRHAYAWKGLGLCLARQGRIDEGVAALEEALNLKPAWLDPYWDLAVVLSEHGRCEDALAVIARARAAVPGAEKRLAALEAAVRRRSEAGG